MTSPLRSSKPEPDDAPLRLNETSTTQLGGIDQNVAALLAYIPILPINVIASIIWFMSEPKSSRFLRFCAMQSLGLAIVFGAASTVLWMFSLIPLLGFIFSIANAVVMLLYIVANSYLCIQAYRGQMVLLPYIGNFVESNI